MATKAKGNNTSFWQSPITFLPLGLGEGERAIVLSSVGHAIRVEEGNEDRKEEY